MRNEEGKTPADVSQSDVMKQLFKMHTDVVDLYAGNRTPSVLLFYFTSGRDGAEEECDSVRQIFKGSNIMLEVGRDLTIPEIYVAIRRTQARSQASALVVVVMGHGTNGFIQATDGHIALQDILNTMCSPMLDGVPKVGQNSGLSYGFWWKI